MRKFDSADLKLLDAVQQNADLTSEELGEICGLSSTAALKRFKKLQKEGVVEDKTAVLSPYALGFSFIAIVLVTLERESKQIIDNLKRSIRECPEIMQGYYITGDADFVLKVAVRDVEEYDKFTREFLYERHSVRSFKTFVILDRLKSRDTIDVLRRWLCFSKLHENL